MQIFPVRYHVSADQLDHELDWEALYHTCYPRVYNFFRFRVGSDDAKDLTAITFERAWQHRRRYQRDQGAFEAWLFGIARKVAAHHLRQLKPVISLDDVQDRLANADQPIEHTVQQHADAERLADLLQQLPDRDRELIALKYGSGLTNRAIARQTGLSESNVGSILYRVVRKLRAEWDENS
ncbi:MAG: sigma-70 family RNA polymerase sigma factor [Anaerolineae bacterium]|nr:sigma-70 family RNA polymerase sigma factor [Anaerolineae bacterium]